MLLRNSVPNGYRDLLGELHLRGISTEETQGLALPDHATMHDHAAPVPRLVVSPRSEWAVSETLRLISALGLYEHMPVSVKSGGHGYFNGASCEGIMINLSAMTGRSIVENTLLVEPGGVLGQTVHTLAQAGKAVPHGDCFAVGAGGHFTTAGWDVLLSRRYGLGCQSVIGARIALWDGTLIDVDAGSHPDLLWALRGGAAAEVGVVTEIRVRLIDAPERVTWRFTRISQDQLADCVAEDTFARGCELPRDVSLSFRLHFEDDQIAPVCSLNIFSLLDLEATLKCLEEHFSREVYESLADRDAWSEGSVLDVRLIPASDFLSENPKMLGEVTGVSLRKEPARFWQRTSLAREMQGSFFTTVSSWVLPDCTHMIASLYEAFTTVQDHPLRTRMYAAVFVGGGRMIELADDCAMPLGKALARFEVHWDELGGTDETWCREFTDKIYSLILSKEDPGPGRPYRGDIWLKEQGRDPRLETVLHEYDRRLDRSR